MKNALYTRVIIGALFAAVAAGTWDVWWHGALGRESFWSPPHLFLYTAVIVSIGTGAYAWYTLREKVWKRVAIALAFIPLSAPLDELWHRLFGVENIASPVIVWSPPHLLLIFGILGSLLVLLPILRRDENREAAHVFGSMALGASITLLSFVMSPLEPTGPHQLLGFFGAGFFGAVLASVLLIARQWAHGFAGATMAAVFFVVLSSLQFGEQIAPGVQVPPHDHAPSWLLVFAALIPAAVSDFFGRKLYPWVEGGVIGLLWSFLLYRFATYFFEPQFQYSFANAFVAIGASTVGGIGAGAVVGLWYPNRHAREAQNA